MRARFLASLLLSGSLLLGTPALAQEAGQSAAATNPAIAALAPVPRGKLTGMAVPQAYRVDTYVDPALDTFSGRTEIDVSLKQPSRFIDLHGRDLGIQSATATAGGRTYAGQWHQLDETGVARLVFPQELPAGPVTLALTYTGAFNESASGLFHARIDDDWYGWSQFQSIDARSVFPSFDEPGFKVPFDVTLRTRPGQMAVSNAPIVSTTRENGWDVHRFAPTLPLPTYLLAMMVGPFVTTDSAVPPTPERDRPLPLRIVASRQHEGKLDFALQNSKEIVAHLEDYFGGPFPFPKLDQITSPLMPGAMENAGADLYEDSLLIVNENDPVSQKRRFGMVVAHELAHQWFGDLVTPAWWDDIWLNESFANWMGYRIGNEWRPDLGIGAGALAEGFQAMNTDALLAGRPIHQPIETNGQIDAAFDTITYGKGGHVVAMIAGFMGDEKFKQGVRRYLSQHRYGNATSEEFFASMAQTAGDPRITAAMQSFTDQQGVPLITITGSDGNYTISQSRYSVLGADAPDTRWGVPVCMRQGETRECQLLTDKSMAFRINGTGPLVPNAGGTGYYRFELPNEGWDALIAQADTLPGAEALALSDSLGASFLAGRADIGRVIALAGQLSQNSDSYARNSATNLLSRLQQQGFFNDQALAAYRAWLGQSARKDLAALGFDPRAGAYAGADADVLQHRQLVVSRLAFAGDPEIQRTLIQAADAYLAGDTSALDRAFLGTALEAKLQQGGLPAAKALLQSALDSQDPVFRPTALDRIGGSGNPDIARWFLDEARDPRLRQPERLGTILSIVGTPETRDLGYEWIDRNLDELMGGSGIFYMRNLPSPLGGFCSIERADQIAARFRPVFAGTPGELSLERALERVRNCAALKQARQAQVNAAVAQLR
ncbi:M1 family metallopeptidase [Altericroceibacterium xinjiangense]|uniref:M1 family metallopeptidase n=1 Tax=Altericroceibacterium xinjiangense TaxID=762261 RepID=UPI000F7E5A40|nr:M1 family metallopeptidase [Altericroceibacterium xinjiangense]